MAHDMTEDWGVPNWKNKDAYPMEDDTLGLNAWRWEFLRRDERYRNAWKRRRDNSYPNGEYGLNGWLDPRKEAEPQFSRPCYELEFDRNDPWEQRLHYMALADSTRMGGLHFSVDIYAPIEAQLETIRDAYNKTVELYVHPDDRVYKAPRKNNSTSKSKARSRGLMLRLLDADNAGVSIPDFLDQFASEEEISISETSMRRTLSFAKEFWKRL